MTSRRSKLIDSICGPINDASTRFRREVHLYKDGYFNQTYVTLLIEVHGLATLENRTVERCIVCNIAQSITDIS